MATTINRGQQTVSFRYQEEAKSEDFNDLLHGLLPSGIYWGGLMGLSEPGLVSVGPLIAFIRSGNNATFLEPHEQGAEDIAVRVRAFGPQTINMADPTKPYAVLRFRWSNQVDNYMDYVAVGYSSDPTNTNENLIMPYDLIIGKALYDDSNALTGQFDYTRRSKVFFRESEDIYNELRVQSSEVSPRKVYVTNGVLNTSQGRKIITGNNYPSGPNQILNPDGTIYSGTEIPDTPVGLGRNDIVFLDETGQVFIQLGEASGSPITPQYRNRKVIAEIRRGPDRDNILGPDIFAVDLGRQGTIAAKDFAIDDTDENFLRENRNLEDAIRILSERNNAVLSDEGTESDGSVKDYHIDWGTSAGQVSAVDIPIDDSSGVITGTEVETALFELAGSGRTVESIKSNKDAIDTVSGDLTTHEALEADTVTVHGINVVSTM